MGALYSRFRFNNRRIKANKRDEDSLEHHSIQDQISSDSLVNRSTDKHQVKTDKNNSENHQANGIVNSSTKRVSNSKIPNKKVSMDVTRFNFVSLIGEIESVVKQCDFVSIDTELTGLRGENTYNLFDTHEERYLKSKENVQEFQVIQFGLCCWKRVQDQDDQSDGHYEVHCYNFYIFPQKLPVPKAHGDRTFLIQSSSLTFLVNCGFDFNKLVKEGISYMNFTEEEQCLEAVKQEEAKKTDSSKKAIQIDTEEDKQFINDILERIKSFVFDENQDKLDLEPCNPFRRRLIYETLKTQTYADTIDVSTLSVTQNSPERFISINKINKEEKQKKQKELLLEAIGFSKVIRFIIENNKPIVGHNLFLDLMHTFNQFIGKLPQTYGEFKISVQTLFPKLYDTKFIASADVFKEFFQSTALGDIYERLKSSPLNKDEIKLMNGVYEEGRVMHEAGFDAYITGYCFINLASYLGSLKEPKINHYQADLLKNYCNKLYITYSFDLKYLNFAGDDVVVNRGHLYHLTFPSQWKSTDLYQLFSAFGGCFIGWINETSAFIALKDEKQKTHVNRVMVNKKPSAAYTIISYEEYTRNKNSKPKVVRSPPPESKPEEPQPKKSKASSSETEQVNKKKKNKKNQEKSKAKVSSSSPSSSFIDEPQWD